MSKISLFLNNFLVYGLGGIIGRIIPFVMLPIVMRIFPDTSYMGVNELFSSISSFATAIAVFGMYDAMFRFFFEKEEVEYKKNICSTSFFFVFINAIVTCCAMIICGNYLANIFFGNRKYRYLVVLAALGTFVNAMSVMMAAPTRMENKSRIFLATNTAVPIISYTIAMVLLLKGYYETALPIGGIISNIGITIVFVVLNRKWFSIQAIDLRELKNLFCIAIPVVPILFIYWVFNSCDRIMLTHMISIKATGIYAVGAKIGTISQLIYTAFAGGWQFFAYSTMNDDDQIEVNSRIFEYLLSIALFSTIGICTFIYPLFKLLFEERYIEAYLIVPYLFFAPLLQMIFQISGSQMTIHKKTWMNTMFLILAAIFNICANYVLIPVIGSEGAAAATLGGYVVAIIMSIFFNLKYRYFIVRKRCYSSIGIFILYFVSWRLFHSDRVVLNVALLVPIAVIYFKLYKNEIVFLIGQTKTKRKEKVDEKV